MMMKCLGGSLVCLFFVSSTAVALENPSVGGFVGFQIAEFENDMDGAGLVLGGEVSAEFARISGVGILGGLGLERGSMVGDEGGSKVETSVTAIGVLGGLQLPITANFGLQSLIRYDIGVSGSSELQFSGITQTPSVKSFSRLTHEWRGMLGLNPKMALGFGLKWFRGALEFDGVSRDFDFKGTTLSALLQYRI